MKKAIWMAAGCGLLLVILSAALIAFFIVNLQNFGR